MAERRVTRGVVAFVAALLAACAPQVATPPGIDAPRPADFPDAHYRRLLAEGKRVYRVEAGRSRMVIEVRRDGPLAQFGHDHVIASHAIEGYIAPDERRADLYVPLAALAVDESALRAKSGFDTQPSAADIAGTRRNMLEKVLESDRHPYALIAASGIEAGGGARQFQVLVALHGTTLPVTVTAEIERMAGEIAVTGAAAIDQSQFGIPAFSILGGAIAVQDRVTVRFEVRALRMEWPVWRGDHGARSDRHG